MIEMSDGTPAAKVFLLESDLPKLLCSGFLSKETSYTLIIDGRFAHKEAEALLKMLTLQISFCGED